MQPLTKFAYFGIDLFCPGPSSGRSGSLRQKILDLELTKRDVNLDRLFAIEQSSPVKSAWVGLGTLAYEIVTHFKPKKIVELGSFGGFSTCAMGLALKHLGEGQIFAVDTWAGDPHTGLYGDEVYEAFLFKRKDLGLTNTICPLRMTFEEASRHITSEIDLLHVDGWHTFRAVNNDFRLFRRHLSPGSLVLFHDVYTGFAQMRFFWAIISRRYPSCLIPYSHGLGIIQIT
jgi:predicted O-methyltransferase YrrM